LVSQVDYGIGLILKELELQGLLDHTIVLYSSDHGDYAGEHGLYEKKGGISFQAITRIPLILQIPQMDIGGRVSDEIIEAVDVFPTLCRLAGIEIPNTCQGMDFLPLFSDDTYRHRSSALTENPYRKAIATREWRYVANLHDDQPDELYDRINDPWELNNRIDDPDCQSVARDLSRMLLDRVVRARRPINTLNGFWYDHPYDRDQRIDLTACGPVTPYW
jgi:arylsulfatase